MYDLLTAQEIRKRIRMHFMKDVSLKAIHAIAQKIGYKTRTIGGKRGYHKSVYTALQQNFGELLAYDANKTKKASQKPQKQPIQGDYYMYNGEKDNKDFDWEVDESVIKTAVNETINYFLNEQRALQTNIFGGVDDLTEKNKEESRKRKAAKLRRERAKEKKEKMEKERKRQEFENDSKRMLNGGLFGNNI